MKSAAINDTDGIVSFGDWVQQRRLALDLTRPALAQQVHCSPSTIKKIERDERRPSRQIAGLLADCLLIPAPERERFVRMARGEFVVTPLSAPDLLSLPRFLCQPDEAAEGDLPPLVARERELAQLMAHLAEAAAGDGGILFVTGEAGDGKTMLAQAFVHQSQEAYTDLVVAMGNCSAYTGIGDPYLPFREILEQLTGDVEARWNADATKRAYAQRLWQLTPQTVQALLDVGPDLVETLLLGNPLLARATAATPAPDKAALDQLQSLIARQQTRRPNTNPYQSNLFAQYTRLLQSLARQQPLLLVLDDLQWIDVGSVNLLFHLCRHLKGQPILIVGLYRPAEVALGRDGGRHPLEPLINELQRNFGDIHVRLNQSDGRHFVDALIDSTPNRLERSFRDALYRQTAGHPLFTVEMLHGLQDRGDVAQDEDGAWVESPQLDWHILPARVEGVIRERIERLPPAMQELLQLASIAGESFYAEVLAQVQGVDARRVTSQLGSVLGNGQRLVVLQGRQQVTAQQLTQYSFRHILFQQYLYNRQDLMQRVYLHQAIAETLEQWYGSQAHLIAPQLARHYAIAGNGQDALRYYTVAGDAAAAVYANAEAAAYYRRAIRLASNTAPLAQRRQLLHLYTQLGRALELSSRHDGAIAVYEEMERVGEASGDQAMVLASLLARAAIRATVNFARNPAEGQALLERAQRIALDLNDQAAQTTILWNLLLLSTYTGGDPQQRIAYGEQALALARKLDLREQLAFTLHDIFYAYAGLGQWAQARTALAEARDRWQRLGNLPMLAEAHMRLHWTYLVTGDYEEALTHAAEANRLGVESHNLDAQALSHFMIGFVYWERGQIEQALTTMEEDIALAETVNSLTPLTGTQADLGLLYGELGDVARGLELAERARITAEEQLPILRYWPHAAQVSLHLLQGDLAGATTLAATLEDYRIVKDHFGYMPFMWIRVGLAHGEVALQGGDFGAAVALADDLCADLCAAGIWYLRPDVLHLKGRAILAQGAPGLSAAQATLTQARVAAETLGSRRALWPILLSLGEVAQRCGDGMTSASLRQEASKIVAEIAESIGTPALQAAFLGLPTVSALYLTRVSSQ